MVGSIQVSNENNVHISIWQNVNIVQDLTNLEFHHGKQSVNRRVGVSWRAWPFRRCQADVAVAARPNDGRVLPVQVRAPLEPRGHAAIDVKHMPGDETRCIGSKKYGRSR